MDTLYQRTDTSKLRGRNYEQVEILEIYSRDGIIQEQVDFYTNNNYLLIQRDLEKFIVVRGIK